MSLPDLFTSLDLLEQDEKAINEQPLTAYAYKPFDEASNEIRLLTLHQGSFESPISTTLTNTLFTSEYVPVFDALSYTWGSPENPIDISVRDPGEEFNASLSVTKNLREALPYLRYEDRDRVLWIDAICVNQQDLQERSQQVQRMAEIYSKATRVVGWLGPSTEQTPVAMKCLETIAWKVRRNPGSPILEATSSDGSWADDNVPPPFSAQEFSAIAEFLSSEWFERLWIYQEIRLSAPCSVLLCGQHIITWLSFRIAVFLLAGKVHLGYSNKTLRDRLIIARNLCDYNELMPLERLIEQTRACKCSDPRDRVFALLSVAELSIRECGITPDYTKSPQEVYTNAFKSIVTLPSNGKLGILRSAAMDETTEWTPTWVPDWSRPALSSLLPWCYASGKSRSVIRFPSDGLMQVEGTVVDSIAIAEIFQPANPRKIRLRAREIKRIVLRLMPTVLDTEDHVLKSVCRALSFGEVSERYIPRRSDLPSFSQIAKHLGDILSASEDSWPAFDQQVFALISTYLKGRCICRTSKGHFIVAPQATRKGDIITVLLGCPNPMILRSMHDGRFQVVGEAYCDEIKEGEALMGQLPTPFKLEHRWVEETMCYNPLFFNSEDGSLQMEDPRLSQLPLPLGWRKYHDPRLTILQRFVNDTSGEQLDQDPRLKAQALRERGVDIRTLNLV